MFAHPGRARKGMEHCGYFVHGLGFKFNIRKISRTAENIFRNMFEEFDEDGSGHIEKDELKEFLASLTSTSNKFSKKKKKSKSKSRK